MPKIILFILTVLISTVAYAENIIIDNQTPYGSKDKTSKIAIQWASSVRETQEINNRMQQGLKMNADGLNSLNKTGKITLNVPKKANYFRVVVWSKQASEPDFVTNWVNVTANKTYALGSDHLVPVPLMAGMGC